MTGNGDSAYAALAARVADLEAALRILARRWDAELTPRLLEIDADVNRLTGAVASLLGK